MSNIFEIFPIVRRVCTGRWRQADLASRDQRARCFIWHLASGPGYMHTPACIYRRCASGGGDGRDLDLFCHDFEEEVQRLVDLG